MKVWKWRIRFLHLFIIYKKPQRRPLGGPFIDQIIYAYSHLVLGPRRNIDGLNNIRNTLPHVYDLQGRMVDDMEAESLAKSLIAEKDFANLLIDLYENYDIVPKKKDCENCR